MDACSGLIITVQRTVAYALSQLKLRRTFCSHKRFDYGVFSTEECIIQSPDEQLRPGIKTLVLELLMWLNNKRVSFDVTKVTRQQKMTCAHNEWPKYMSLLKITFNS